MDKVRNDCYKCPHRREVPGSVHSSCHILKPQLRTAIALMAMCGQMPTITNEKTGEDLLILNPTGVKEGWYNWPIDFDPVWVECYLPMKEFQEAQNEIEDERPN